RSSSIVTNGKRQSPVSKNRSITGINGLGNQELRIRILVKSFLRQGIDLFSVLTHSRVNESMPRNNRTGTNEDRVVKAAISELITGIKKKVLRHLPTKSSLNYCRLIHDEKDTACLLRLGRNRRSVVVTSLD